MADLNQGGAPHAGLPGRASGLHAFRTRVRGGILAGLWCGLAFLVILLFFVIVFSAPGWICALAAPVALGCAMAFGWSNHLCRITVSASEVRIQRGGLFKATKRMPSRFVTGCTIVATPVQRVLGLCCLVVHTPGTGAVVLGLARGDAVRIADLVAGVVEP